MNYILVAMLYYIISFLIILFFAKKNKLMVFSFTSFFLFTLGWILYVFLCGIPIECSPILTSMLYAMIFEPIHYILFLTSTILLIIKWHRNKN